MFKEFSMATGQGAAGVRIKLRDLSEVQIVNEPIITAGVVGFSSKGPLNKIIALSSTASMDSVLGSGYNNPKFNQGLYASRGILNARGNVEFVRPFGETIITDNTDSGYDTNQQLKSDAFVVNYDFATGATNSLEISHYAATRYKTDGMAVDFPGSSRQIYTISDALVENTNVNFELNTSADVSNPDSVPLFAIINDDPTAAIRAENDDAVDPTTTGNDYLLIKTAASNTAGKYQESLTISKIPVGGDTVTVLKMDGSKSVIEFVAPGGTLANATATPVAIPTQTITHVTPTDAGATPTPIVGSLTIGNTSSYVLGDRVVVSIGSGATIPTGLVVGTIYKVSAISGNAVTITTEADVAIDIQDAGTGALYLTNLTLTLRSLATVFKTISFGVASEIKSTTPSNSKTLTVTAVRGPRIPATITSFYTLSITGAWLATGSFNLLDTTVRVLIESSIGRTFVSLGLATESYIDINYDGVLEKVYTLTADGAALAALYMDVSYMFSGTLYNFVGTIVPYVLNQQNMYIVDQAQNVQNGFQFIINEHPDLAEAAASTSFDLSQTISNALVSSYTTKTSYMSTDPGLTHIWSYDPRKNNSSSILGSAWNLFLKKDQTQSDMLISAGTAISNLFARGYEAIDYNVMETMLTICELRKDCFAIFDGVDENRIDKALNKMVGIGTEGNDVGRWGAIFDGRSFMFDTVYTKLTVEVVKSIEVAQIIAFNRASGVYWLAPAGFQSGRIPSSMASRQKYIRSYGYGADDPNSDIAKLYDANINPTRVTQAGAFIFGQKTMLRRNTALNRLNVIMLIAGIHRRFATYLDDKTFQLNTAQLRSNIQSELQAQIDAIKTANPAGLTAGRVVCDGTNNTPDIIDTNQLIVDVIIQPTRTAEFITLRTTVQRTGADLTTNTAIIGG